VFTSKHHDSSRAVTVTLAHHITRLWLVDINAVYILIFEVGAYVKYVDT